MKLRLCDKCKKEIPPKEIFYKVMKVSWIGEKKNHLKLEHVADMCKYCWVGKE